MIGEPGDISVTSGSVELRCTRTARSEPEWVITRNCTSIGLIFRRDSGEYVAALGFPDHSEVADDPAEAAQMLARWLWRAVS